jgi:hypothetical protein
MRTFSKRTMIVAAASAAALTAGGIAYAYYTAGVAGTGTGTANVATANTSAVTFTGSAPVGFAPGVTKSVSVTPHNSNTYSVHIAAQTISVSSASSANCTNTQAAMTGSGTLAAQTIAAGGNGTPAVFNVTMGDPDLDQTSCAGESLTVTYAATLAP